VEASHIEPKKEKSCLFMFISLVVTIVSGYHLYISIKVYNQERILSSISTNHRRNFLQSFSSPP
jgi:hypothetical protein